MVQSGSKFMLGLLGLLLLFLTGCPVDSSVTLSPISEAEIDMALVENWVVFQEGKPDGEFRIYPFNEHEIVVIPCEYGALQESQDEPLRAFTSLIAGERFLNIQSMSEKLNEERTWMFVNYQVNGDELRYRIVDDMLFKNKDMTSQELVEFIKNNLDNKDLYGKSDAYKVLKRSQQ